MICPQLFRVALFVFGTNFVLSLPAAETAKSGSAPGAASPEALKAAGLTSAQLLTGAKTGLGILVDLAGAALAKPGAVNISAPSSMEKLETTLKRMNQSAAFDSFKASLNQ